MAHINDRIQQLEEGNFSVEDETPATEVAPEGEQPSGEQNNPQKFVNTNLPNRKADREEWARQIQQTEEEKGRPLSD